MTNIASGQTAPPFSLTSLDGKEVSLGSLLQRRSVLVSFFKISCPVCQFTFPFIERLYERYGSGDVAFLGISQDNAKATKEFMKECGVTFPVLLDGAGYPASNSYGLSSVPTIFLIDQDGTVKIASMGFVRKDLESIASDLSQRQKFSTTPLFRPDESVPENRPG